MNAVTHLEKVIVGEVSAVTHLEKVIAGETSAVTYTEKVITGEAPPITHLQKVIAGEASPVTHLEHIWAGGSPTPTEHEYTGAVPYTFTADGTPLIDWYIKGNATQSGTPTPSAPVDVVGVGTLDNTVYKIPITCSGTTSINLSSVQTTRKINKLVFDGTENFTLASTDTNRTVCQLPLRGCKGNYGFCTHILWKSSYESSEYNRLVWTTTSGGTLFISLSNEYLESQTAADFKTYLQQQYANGTPVCVWYVLATEETGIVNEPLMKIGDYADEVSNVATIPTNNGSTTIDVDTTVKPSEIYIKYKGV